MKFDKETIIVLVIAGLIMAGWFFFYPQYQKEQAEKAQQQKQVQLRNQIATRQQKDAQASVKTVTPAPATPAENAAPAPAATEKSALTAATEEKAKTTEVKIVEEAKAATEKATGKVETPAPQQKVVVKPVSLANENIKFTFDPATGTLISAELLKYKRNVDSEEGDNLILKPEGEALRAFYAGEDLSAPAASVKVTEESDSLTISRTLPKFTVEETFTLKPDSYTLDVKYTVTNTAAEILELKELTFWAAGVPPIQSMSDDRINTDRHNIDFSLANGETDWFTPDFNEDSELHSDYQTNTAAKWVGSTNKYFASLLFSDSSFQGGLRFKQTMKDKMTIPSVGGAVADEKLSPGQSVSYKMQYYCGPKELARVEQLDETAVDAMHIAYWSWFEFIARPIARFLVWLGQLIGNYGIAIILLTLLVRALLWPLVQKSNNSMRKMQKIQPKMKELREKYKDDQQELSMRMMELYRTEGVNPLGGCLPMLLQIPIFFAMYSVFDSAVELRHVSFLWAKDLAQPDAIGPEIFGLQLHPLIIMMTILMVLQQKMTPSQMEPMQQKIMMAVPIIMLVMLYWLPSGLTLYWTISQAVSIIQLKVGQKIAEKEETAAKGGTKPVKAK